MKEEFKAGLTKKYGFTDDKFILGKEEYPYSSCSYIQIFQAPTIWSTGMAEVEIKGKKHTLSILMKDMERAMNAFIYMNKKIDESNNVIKTYKYHIWAHTGTKMEVYDDYLIINLMPPSGYVVNSVRGCGNGDKRIRFSDITSIQYREPTNNALGFIQFAYPGSPERNGNFEAILKDENAIPIRNGDATLAKEIVEYIEQKRIELKNAEKNAPVTVIASTSSADELKKFKELLDLGIITQEEFDAKKKQLLDL